MGWLRRKSFPIVMESLTDGVDVMLRGRKANLIHKNCAIGSAGILSPLQNLASTGIIISKSVNEWVVRVEVSTGEFPQIPGSSLNIEFGIQHGQLPEDFGFLSL